jgi:hypothetical protein
MLAGRGKLPGKLLYISLKLADIRFQIRIRLSDILGFSSSCHYLLLAFARYKRPVRAEVPPFPIEGCRREYVQMQHFVKSVCHF